MRQGRGTGRGDKEAETGGALHFDDLRGTLGSSIDQTGISRRIVLLDFNQKPTACLVTVTPQPHRLKMATCRFIGANDRFLAAAHMSHTRSYSACPQVS